MYIRHFSFNLFQENSYVIWKTAEQGCIVIDPGFCKQSESDAFFGLLKDNGLTPKAVLLTHGHMDHIYGARELSERYGIPVYMHSEERKVMEADSKRTAQIGIKGPDFSFTSTDVADNDTVNAAGMELKVITTPGHSPGSVCYLLEDEGVMFTGDTLFAGTIGRTDLMFGDYDDEIRSIMEKLIWLDPSIEIFPGHGPSSSIGRERTGNPFLEPWGEAEEETDPENLEPVSIIH